MRGKWKRTWDGWKHATLPGLEKLDQILGIGVFVVRGEILKSLGHESVLRLIPSYQNEGSKDTQNLIKCLAKKKWNFAFLASKRRVFIQVPTGMEKSFTYFPILAGLSESQRLYFSLLITKGKWSLKIRPTTSLHVKTKNVNEKNAGYTIAWLLLWKKNYAQKKCWENTSLMYRFRILPTVSSS